MQQKANGSLRISPLAWSLVGMLIVAVAIAFRLFDLERKPMHHDEGVNALFVIGLMKPPYTYRYDPANFHGPTLYYLAKPAALTVGLTTFGLRLVPALCGIAIVLLAIYLRPWIGSAGSLAAAALLAVSPGAIYFSRYFIHESLLVCFTFGTVVAAWYYLQQPRAICLMLASVMAGLMFATKETAIIAAGVLVIAGVASWLFFRRGTRGQPFHLTLRHAGLVIVCIGMFVGVNVLFYSSFFANWEGLSDALRSFAVWTHTGTRDHVHRWDTYLWWLAREEMPLLALGLVGSGLAFWHARNAFVVFASLWAVGTLLAYSLIPYKTPWLTLNIIVPFAIVGGWAAEVLYLRAPAVWRRVLLALGVLAISISAYQAVVLNFVRYDDDRYGYVYAHTRRAVLDLTRRIAEIRAHAGSGLTIAVVSPDQFPLSWYLRDYRAGYYGSLVRTNDPIYIGSQTQDEALRAQLGDGYVRIGSYSLRPGVDLVLYVRRDLASR